MGGQEGEGEGLSRAWGREGRRRGDERGIGIAVDVGSELEDEGVNQERPNVLDEIDGTPVGLKA